MNTTYDRRIVFGAILVAIGLVLLATEWFAVTDDAIRIASIAVVLLVAYALTRAYGFLVPGMILLGSAIATGVQDYGYDPTAGLVAVFIGAGFLGIWVVDFFARDGSRWWPLVPGSILVLYGGAVVTEGTTAGRLFEQFWPLVLVVAGIVVLFSASRQGGRSAAKPSEKPAAL